MFHSTSQTAVKSFTTVPTVRSSAQLTVLPKAFPDWALPDVYTDQRSVSGSVGKALTTNPDNLSFSLAILTVKG